MMTACIGLCKILQICFMKSASLCTAEEPADVVISLDCSQTDEHVTVSGEVKGTGITEQHTKSFLPA